MRLRGLFTSASRMHAEGQVKSTRRHKLTRQKTPAGSAAVKVLNPKPQTPNPKHLFAPMAACGLGDDGAGSSVSKRDKVSTVTLAAPQMIRRRRF